MSDGTPLDGIELDEYSKAVEETDVLPKYEVGPVLMGLYGEVGGIMATAKKHVREKGAFPGYQAAAQEEFGDTLWYLAAYCRRQGIPLGNLFRQAVPRVPPVPGAATNDPSKDSVPHIAPPASLTDIDQTFFRLGRAAAALLGESSDAGAMRPRLEEFTASYLAALDAAAFDLTQVARFNITKTRGAFVAPDLKTLPRFDDDFDEEERIPSTFRIRVNQRQSGRSYLRWNEVFIGDPLTDNSADPDGYRFHDVFHFAHAAILHWSPVLRALIKQKRKSSARHDDIEDGGRAIVVEEGLTAWIFSRAKDLNYFEDHERISYGLLKTIQEFTVGYEVSRCPLKLWERAILQGYAVFRRLRDARGGWIQGDRDARTLRFEPL